MTAVRAAAFLLLILGLESALGRFWPSASRFVDLFILPTVWFGVLRGPKGGMLVGCAAGLMQDAWFQAGILGLNGFKKTLLGWAVGGLGGRIDLNGQVGRMGAGVAFVLGDLLLDLALRKVLALDSAMPSALDLLIKCTVTALLVSWSFVPARLLGGEGLSRMARRPG